MEKITIKGRSFDYEPEELTYENATLLNFEEATENLLLFNDIARKNKFDYLLYYGTLLGVIRENNFIAHDIDIDVITENEDGLLVIIPDLLEKGFSFIRYESTPTLNSATTLYSFRRKSVYIDVYIAYKEKRKYNLLGTLVHKKYIEEKISREFIGDTFSMIDCQIKCNTR